MSHTVDPRIAVLSSMTSPERTPDMVGMPWDDAVKELDAYRAKVLRLAAEAIEQEFLDGITDSDQDQTWNAAVQAIATSLRQSADKPENPSDG
ncbi:hypothetical protein [Streptomyces sp. AMCC400023]|uniref:hypothetical protein n=1 Tax=Streptomyces sp. AMCC400023 TaxID=2056258 RepID=UPI001F22C0C3|nr:hypothetical protein [Streptomyces sp. AMCC400023]UJV42055.1 hypothetical protein CVT30_21375 [Streptomyces sp. AMCC400023]